MQKKLILAPMLGITDQVFRDSFAKFFPGFDEAYAPFIKVNQFGEFKLSKMRELSPEKNLRLKVTPQIMCNHASAFITVANQLAQMGYESINWNLGCPSPSSSSRNLGCGLIPEVELVDELLNDICNALPIGLSIKTRLGLESPTEIIKLSKVFNRYPLEHVIVHPRTGKQGYSGKVDLEAFSQVQEALIAPLYFSGDITNELIFSEISKRFPSVNGFLIGRGALQDPQICHKIKNPNSPQAGLDLEHYSKFIEEIWGKYLDQCLSSKDIAIKVRTICSYLAASRGFSQKTMRKIRKARHFLEFSDALLGDSTSVCQDDSGDEGSYFNGENLP